MDSVGAKYSIAETEVIVQKFADQWGFKPKAPAQDIAPLEDESEQEYETRCEN